MHVSSIRVKPGEHTQSASCELPVPSAAVLLGQSEHASDPTCSLYVLMAQAVHSPPSAPITPVYPALHTHCVADVAPAALTLNAGQLIHVWLPVNDLYVSVGHASHPPPVLVLFVYPWSQRQPVTLSAPGKDELFGGHDLQV